MVGFSRVVETYGVGECFCATRLRTFTTVFSTVKKPWRIHTEFLIFNIGRFRVLALYFRTENTVNVRAQTNRTRRRVRPARAAPQLTTAPLRRSMGLSAGAR